MVTRRALVLLLLSACASSSDEADGPKAEEALIQRLSGNWRLLSYSPAATTLSPAMLLALQADKLVVNISHGRIRSSSGAVTFDRRLRVADVFDDRFRAYIVDETGLEYELWCRLDPAGRLHFEARTAPWEGRGELVQESSLEQ